MTNILIKNLTQKNEALGMEAAKSILDNSNLDAFAALCEKSDFLFDFVKDNVCKRLYNAANVTNYKNILNLFSVYDDTYADVFVKILSKFGNEDLTKELLAIFEIGSSSQKAYCAKYFEKNHNNAAIENLNQYAFSDDECLSINCIKALSACNNRTGIYTAYEKLKSDDVFEVLKGIRFLTTYPDFSHIDDLVNVAINSSMPENAAQEIANSIDLYEFINEKQTEDRLSLLNSIINGLGEILPLGQVLYYGIFDIIRFLINQSYEEENSQISQILLNMKLKFKLFVENDEYTYDEDIETKNELKKIFVLLNNQGEDFWNEQKQLLVQELSKSERRICATLNLIKEMEEFDNVEAIVNLTNSNNELIVCQAIEALNSIGKIEYINVNNILKNIKNENIAAIIKNVCPK